MTFRRAKLRGDAATWAVNAGLAVQAEDGDIDLTDAGRDLLPVLDALLAWGVQHAVSADDPDRMKRYPTPSERLAQHP